MFRYQSKLLFHMCMYTQFVVCFFIAHLIGSFMLVLFATLQS